MAQGLSTPDPPLSPTHLMVSRSTTLVPSLGLRIGPACEAGLSAGMRREHVSPQKEKERERSECFCLKLVELTCIKCC